TWASCSGTQSADSWDILSNGTIAPRYAATEDLLLGGTSTSTAKFAVLNIAGGIPAASVSAQNAANQALVLGSDGSIQTVRNQTLTIGGGTTGNIVLKPNNGTNGTIQFSGYGTGIIHSVNGLLTSSGIVAADLTAGDFSSAINSGTYSINISGNASTSSASFYAVNAGLASFANAAATSSTAFYSTNAGHASSADAATSATTASAAFTATHVTSVDLANNVGSSVLSILNGGTGTSSTPSNGKLLIGNSSNGYTIAGLTGGQGVAIQEGSGSITVNSTFFNQALGALFEGNTTQDFLLGGTATNSSTTNYARFGILNVN